MTGHYLPLATDTILASVIARELAQRYPVMSSQLKGTRD